MIDGRRRVHDGPSPPFLGGGPEDFGPGFRIPWRSPTTKRDLCTFTVFTVERVCVLFIGLLTRPLLHPSPHPPGQPAAASRAYGARLSLQTFLVVPFPLPYRHAVDVVNQMHPKHIRGHNDNHICPYSLNYASGR